MATTTEPNTLAKLQQYIEGVLSGDIVACKWVRLAVQRHVSDIENGHERGVWFDNEEASLAVDFIEMLKHSKGKWAGGNLALEPWQVFIVASLFGLMKTGNSRRFNTAFISVARKNGKSTLGAGIGIKLLVMDGEQGAEVYSAACKRDQARIVHDEAKRMVKASACLQSVITTFRDNLVVQSTNSLYKPLGADADSTDGLNISGAIVDEVHAHKNRAMWDVLETATGARQNPLIVAITTAGDAGDHESIYWELKTRTEKVLQGAIEDDSWFGVIYTLDETDDWTHPAVWPKANPNLGVSVNPDDLARKAKKAQETPDALANFKRKHLNTETESSNPWLSTEPGSLWDKCRDGDFYGPDGLLPEVIERYRGQRCYVGGDLSSLSDLTALAFAFPHQGDNDSVDVIIRCWCPRENAVGRTRDKRVPYMTWAREGILSLTEGNSVDYNCLRAILRTARDEWGWKIQQIAIDPNNARYFFTQLLTRQEEGGDGWEETQVIEHLQTTNFMNERIGAAEKLILDGRLRHGGNKLLRWCVSNAMIYSDTGGRRRFDKKHVREKIDAAVAMVMAVGLASGDVVTDSVYETRGVLSV